MNSMRLAVFALLVFGGPAVAVAASPQQRASLPFVKGYTWGWDGARGVYDSQAARDSMRKLAATGVDHVCIAFATEMATPDSPDFKWGQQAPRMVSDGEVRHAIALARGHNLKVILKPTINCADQTWRAWISFYRPLTSAERDQGLTGVEDPWGPSPVFREGETVDQEKWDRWWDNYRAFLMHYAQIAADEQVEAYCLGCEMNSTESFVDRWRSTIGEIRSVYTGKLTYNCNHGREEQLPWWDALDFISVSAYYQTPAPEGQTVEEAAEARTPKSQMLAELARVKSSLALVSQKWNRPILFIETGVTNVRGAARYPWSHPYAKPDSPIDDQEQALFYEAMLETFWDEPWMMGFCWWDWPARLYPAERAPDVRSFCVYGRPAEQTLKTWYAKPRKNVELGN